MGLYYSLNKEIKSDKLSLDINNLINRFVKENGNENLLLCIEIKKISVESNDLVPKLEHKNL